MSYTIATHIAKIVASYRSGSIATPVKPRLDKSILLIPNGLCPLLKRIECSLPMIEKYILYRSKSNHDAADIAQK